MHNMVYLIGRLAEDVNVEGELGTFDINVQCYDRYDEKEERAKYRILTFNVHIHGQITTHTAEYVHKGDLVGIKGQLDKDENENIFVSVDRITFLASAKKEKEEK